MEPLLTLVMPAYNEELALSSELPGILSHCQKRNWRLVIVDDGSLDATPDVLAAHASHPCLSALRHKVNRGYGGALKTGILSVRTPYLATIDADGQHRLDDVENLLSVSLNSDADLVVGSRKGQPPLNRYRECGKRIIRTVARILVPNTISDLNSGLKLYRTELAKRHVILCPDSMAFSDVITLVFINQRCRVLEHPIAVNERIAGESTVDTRSAISTVREIFNLLMLFNPLRLLFPISLGVMLAGAAWSIPIFLEGRGLSVAALLLILSGLIIFFFGLIAEQLSLIRKERMAFFNHDEEH
ncbi:MAG: glycosyltransferase family 2 protein [Gammaproteobacteria bacterium]